MGKGRLYICPTPIGNLEDISLRVLKTLKSVDLIAAEDTRHTLKLLNHFQIEKPLTSYHDHNTRSKGRLLIEKLLGGKDIALVSDAGMPGISDPGEDIIRECIDRDISFEVLPGPTASILALVGSGLSTSRFAFEGFLGRDRKERQARLEIIKEDDRTLIFYEAPHRIIESLEDILQVLGNRRAVVARELTKKYQEFIRGTIKEIIEVFKENRPRGEMVLVCQGADLEELEREKQKHLTNIAIRDHIVLFMKEGLDKKSAIREVARVRKLPRREVYKESIGL